MKIWQQLKCFKPQSRIVYGTNRSKEVILMWFLFCVPLCFLSWGVLCWVLPCSLFHVFFSVLFSIVITSLYLAYVTFLSFFSSSRWSGLAVGCDCRLWLWHSLDIGRCTNKMYGRTYQWEVGHLYHALIKQMCKNLLEGSEILAINI